MEISADLLMAYADGELDAATAAQVEAALRDDAELAARVAAHRALRERLRAAFAADLQEPVPQRLVDAVQRTAPVAGGALAGAAPGTRRARASRRWWRSPLPLAVAAGFLGLGIGIAVLMQHLSGDRLYRGVPGALVAEGGLARALSDDLSGPGAAGGVDVVLSFVSRTGEYCRAFRITGSAPRSGVACRNGAQWRIEALARSHGEAGQDAGYRTAGSSLPPAVLQAIQTRLADQPLDRAGEIAARDRGWRAVPRR